MQRKAIPVSEGEYANVAMEMGFLVFVKAIRQRFLIKMQQQVDLER
jgi:hypothetical protein